MYLKSLEMQGFKSFPDKTKLTFDNGMTAVVGPNGSGKSNISDAVRWVLGEQSVKTLRGGKMEDVIFSGTADRKQSGFASVTLTIDNSNSIFPIEADEVCVTRKLYRNGDSEYRINGKSVRLKDVNELFMDTGLGRDGYSIVGQGRIAEIVSAKSNERRMVFEEASGISKFRYKKTEAEKKLEQAESNLLRLNDIATELEQRIEPLQIQSEKAQRYIKLAGQKKTAELSIWLKRLEEITKSVSELSDKILLKTAEYEQAERAESEDEQKISDNYEKMREATTLEESFRTKTSQTEKILSDCHSQIAVAQNETEHYKVLIEENEKRIADSEKSKVLIAEQISEYSLKIGGFEKQAEALRAELAETERQLEEHNLETEKVKSKSEAAEKMLHEKELKRAETFTQLENFKNNLADTRKRIEDSETKLAQRQEKTEQLKAEISELLEQSETVKRKAVDNMIGYTQICNKKREFTELYEQAKKEVLHEEKELSDTKHRLKILGELEKTMEGFSTGVKAVLKYGKKHTEILGTVSQLITVKSEYATAVQTALGNAVQNIVVENENTAEEAIEYLKKKNAGRATFLPLTSVRGQNFDTSDIEAEKGYTGMADTLVQTDERYREIISSLLGRIVVADNLRNATAIAQNHGYRFKIVTLDGQIINAGGSFTGGSLMKSGGILTRKSETEELLKVNEKLEKEYHRLIEKRKEIENQLLDYIEKEENVHKQQSDIEAEKIKIEAETNAKKKLLIQFSDEDKTFEAETKILLETAENLETKIEQAEKDSEQLTTDISEIKDSMSGDAEIINSMAEKQKLLGNSVSDLKIRLVEVEKDIEATTKEKLSAETEQRNLVRLCNESITAIEILKKDTEKKKACIVELEKKCTELTKNIEKYKEKVLEYRKNHDNIETIITQIRAELKKVLNRKENISRELSRTEEKKTAVSKQSDEIILKMWEEYELTRSEAEKLAEPAGDTEKTQLQLDVLKKQIKELGDVNIGAIEEYKEVSERYNFMSAQLDDVRKSKAELEKLISELTGDMKKIFTESFTQINENFGKIFTDLFGGGKAQLKLTEPENPLETGIEIEVTPPGKVIKNLISLSGGEQAFVAIAIYFAILSVNPAPFCILDEIDAALDEVNVKRYAEYLRKFTQTTQFIAVTHRRGTMETADILYGVTMQDNGISKLMKLEQTPD